MSWKSKQWFCYVFSSRVNPEFGLAVSSAILFLVISINLILKVYVKFRYRSRALIIISLITEACNTRADEFLSLHACVYSRVAFSVLLHRPMKWGFSTARNFFELSNLLPQPSTWKSSFKNVFYLSVTCRWLPDRIATRLIICQAILTCYKNVSVTTDVYY